MTERMVSLLIGYVFGLFQTSYIYGRMKHIDIRNYGSGNAGATNALRTLGKKAGLITVICDILKPVAAALITYFLYRNSYPDYVVLLGFYAGFGAVIGHIFPFYLGFRGGKGIAAVAGIGIWFGIANSCWYVIPLGVVTFFLVLALTKYVSLSSILLICGYFFETILFGQLGMIGIETPYLYEVYIITGFLAVLTIWKHYPNIKRLLSKTENKFFLSKKEEKPCQK